MRYAADVPRYGAATPDAAAVDIIMRAMIMRFFLFFAAIIADALFSLMSLPPLSPPFSRLLTPRRRHYLR